jgi:hypothetical protein
LTRFLKEAHSMFKKLKQHAVTSDLTAWFPLPEAGHPEAAVQVRPATEANKPYHSAIIRSTVKRARRMARGSMSAEDLKKARAEDRKLFPAHIIVGFRNIPDDHNPDQFVDFSREAAEMLCEVCPAHLFDTLRDFAGDHENFYADATEAPIGPGDEEEVEELAENSESVSSGS